METVYAARFFRCELSLYRYGYVSARFETADKTVRASRYMSALLNFAAHPIVFPLRSLRGRCRLRQMRCNYIRAVGATLLTYVSVLPVPTGRATAITVSAQCKCASEKMCLPDGKDLITPHPSPKVTPSPQATQGKAKGAVCDRPDE